MEVNQRYADPVPPEASRMDGGFAAENFPIAIAAVRLAVGLSMAVLGLAGLPGEALAQDSTQPQYYPSAQGPDTPAPPPRYEDGLPSPGRGYTYGNWEPVRLPGEQPSVANNPNDRADYASRPPMEITPPQADNPAAGPSPPSASGYYAALPAEDQPETGRPKELPPRFRRQIVDYSTPELAGTIIVDAPNTYLYLILGNGRAMRYGIGVGREGFTWSGREKVTRTAEWPDWHPPKEMIGRQPYLPRFMAGGEGNPLGARALYLGNTLYRIHGTNQPSTIGSFVSSGCIRLTNNDIEDLYSRVTVGTKVVVLPGGSVHHSVNTTASDR